MYEMRTMHIFAGSGGGILSDLILGHKPIVAVEWDSYCCQVLRERVADGWLPNMRVHEEDIRLFDPSEYKGRVDCINAGFPCQDISNAGNKAGIGEGTRSGLYREVLRISDEIRPKHIFMENVAAIVNGDDGAMLRTVVGDLAERGFDAVWCRLAASQIGARHKRDRWWLLGYPASESGDGGRIDRENGAAQTSESGSAGGKNIVANTCAVDAQRKQPEEPNPQEWKEQCDGQARSHGDGNRWRQTKPQICGMADDVAHRMDVHDWVQEEAQVGRTTTETKNRANRLKALGNGQVPLQAATAFSILWKIMILTKKQ